MSFPAEQPAYAPHPAEYPPQPPHTPPPATNGLSIAAIILAVIMPLIGMILGQVARSTAKKQGRQDGLATAAVVVGGVLTLLLGLAAVVVFVVSLLFPSSVNNILAGANPSSPPTTEAVTEERNRIVLGVYSSQGATIEAELRDAAIQNVMGRLERADLTPAYAAESGDAEITVTFPDAMAAVEVRRAEQLLTLPNDSGFYEFVYEFSSMPLAEKELAETDLDPEEIAAFQISCAELLTESVEAFSGEIFCPISQLSKFALGEFLLDGAEISSVEKTDDVTLLLALTHEGGLVFSNISAQAAEKAAAGQNRIALVANREVIIAPRIDQPIPGGQMQFYIDDDTIDEVYSVFLLLSKSVSVEVSAVCTD